MLSPQSRLNLYLALSLITSLVMVAADHGEPWRRMVHGVPREDGGGWKPGRMEFIGSQGAFPETDYWASLIRPLVIDSFFGHLEK